MSQLHGRRDPSLLPVVDALDTPFFVEAKQLGDLGGAAKSLNEFTVHIEGVVAFHGDIKHDV